MKNLIYHKKVEKLSKIMEKMKSFNSFEVYKLLVDPYIKNEAFFLISKN